MLSNPHKTRLPRLRTILTAAAILTGGFVTGTLLAQTPLFDFDLSSLARPAFHDTDAALQGNSVPSVPQPVFASNRHEPQGHILHSSSHALATVHHGAHGAL